MAGEGRGQECKGSVRPAGGVGKQCWTVAAQKERDLRRLRVAEYAPGTPLGWHRDVPDFETIAGVSLGGEALLRFRPYPLDEAARRQVLQLEVAPRSIYQMAGIARWGWQHSVPPVKARRWSITFRTPRCSLR